MISRIIAGFGTTMNLVVCSSLVMTKLNIDNKIKVKGFHYYLFLHVFVIYWYFIININKEFKITKE
jgi:hypothetical protein